MPVFNGKSFIAQAVESILKQTYSNFELLVYDDCSNDSTLDIIKSISDPRIVLYEGRKNIGSLKARNILFKRANGEYFIFQDADDWSDKNRIEKLIFFMEAHPNYGLCGSNVKIYNENGKHIITTDKPIDENEIKENFSHSIPIYFPSSIVRKSVYEVVGGFKEYFYNLGNYDYDWMCRISENFSCSNIPDGLYNATRRGISNSTTIENPYKVVGHELVRFLAKQRKNNGKDCLEQNPINLGELEIFVKKAYEPYQNDPSLFTYDRIVGLMSENMFQASTKLAVKSIFQNPKKIRNYRTFLYVLRKWLLLNK